MDISEFFNPFRKIETSQGELSLYRSSMSEIVDLGENQETPKSEVARRFFQYVVEFPNGVDNKRESSSDKRSSPEQVQSLSDEDLECLAAVYIPDVLLSFSKRTDPIEEKTDSQSNIEYLCYLLEIYLEYCAERRKAAKDSLDLLKRPLLGSIFDRSVDALIKSPLVNSKSIFDRQEQPIFIPPRIHENPAIKHSRDSANAAQKSSISLEKLVENAKLFMDISNQRDIESKRQDKERDIAANEQSEKQLRVASWGIWASVVPAVMGLVISYFSYDLANKADKENGLMQERMLSLIEKQNSLNEVLQKELAEKDKSTKNKSNSVKGK